MNPCRLQPANPLSQGRHTPGTYRRRNHGMPLPCLESLQGYHAPEPLAAPKLPGVVLVDCTITPIRLAEQQ
jgi:hypothetical protein